VKNIVRSGVGRKGHPVLLTVSPLPSEEDCGGFVIFISAEKNNQSNPSKISNQTQTPRFSTEQPQLPIPSTSPGFPIAAIALAPGISPQPHTSISP